MWKETYKSFDIFIYVVVLANKVYGNICNILQFIQFFDRSFLYYWWHLTTWNKSMKPESFNLGPVNEDSLKIPLHIN